jgi:hypothetical protein
MAFILNKIRKSMKGLERCTDRSQGNHFGCAATFQTMEMIKQSNFAVTSADIAIKQGRISIIFMH